MIFANIALNISLVLLSIGIFLTLIGVGYLLFSKGSYYNQQAMSVWLDREIKLAMIRNTSTSSKSNIYSLNPNGKKPPK